MKLKERCCYLMKIMSPLAQGRGLKPRARAALTRCTRRSPLAQGRGLKLRLSMALGWELGRPSRRGVD